jgi:chemotaxis response regulator CheB
VRCPEESVVPHPDVRAGSGTPLPLRRRGWFGVGASAGGLEALERLLSHVPAASGLAFVVIQHLDRHHPSRLAELLGRSA